MGGGEARNEGMRMEKNLRTNGEVDTVVHLEFDRSHFYSSLGLRLGFH